MSFKCIAIGVGQVEEVEEGGTEFPFLDGAWLAAETIGRWAISAGAEHDNVIVLTDRKQPVIDTDLRNAFDRLLPAGQVTDHLVVAFAGHGLTGISDDVTYWLLSDSLTQGYNIFVEDLRREIMAYGVRHLTIVSDACRAIANVKDLRDLRARPGVTRRQLPTMPGFSVVRYNACGDTQKSFMVKTQGSAALGKCIFSGVLTEALWGQIPECFNGSVIDNMSLGLGLASAVADRARTYDLELSPGGSSGFARIVYYDSARPPAPPNPALEAWPAVAKPAMIVPLAPAPEILPGLDSAQVFKKVLSNATVRRKILGKDFGDAHPDIDTSMEFPGLPEAAEPMIADVAWSRSLLGDSKLIGKQSEALRTAVAASLKEIEIMAAAEARTRAAERITAQVKRLETAKFSAGVNLLVLGSVKQVWAPSPTVRLDRDKNGRVDLLIPPKADGQQLLIEFDNGLFAPFVPYPDLVGMMVCDAVGIQAVNYSTVHAHRIDTVNTAHIISELRTGKLNAQMIDQQAIELRQYKHVNPVFGAIAAHCYDVIGDFNSARRMAFYYAMNGQPAPYDVVFMAMLENDGETAAVLAVEADSHRQNAGLPEWLVGATYATSVNIGGRCPWLRQGWDFMSAPEDVEKAMVGNLGALRGYLKPAPFTTLDTMGGEALVQIWGLQPCL